MERDIEISKGVIETLTPLLSDYSQHFSVTFQHSDGRLISVYCNTSEFVSELFHLPLFRQIPVWLGRWSKNRWTDEPQSWNHFAIDSLNCWLFGQSAAIITSFKREKFMQVIDKVILLSYYVQLASRFWCHFTCIVCVRGSIFPDLKHRWIAVSDILMTRICDTRVGLSHHLANQY